MVSPEDEATKSLHDAQQFAQQFPQRIPQQFNGAQQSEASRRHQTARQLDAALGPVDWTKLPDGTMKDQVDVPSGQLARISLGPTDGERVLLVPGVTGSKEDFILMMPLFAAEGYRVEAYDLAGQYESAAAGPEQLNPPSNRYTLQLFADDLHTVLSAGRAPAHVLGYSFAGSVAAAVAVADPSLFRSLTFLSAPPGPGDSLRSFKKIGALSRFISGRTLGPLFISALRYNVHRAPAHRAGFVSMRLESTRPSSVGDVLALMQRTPDFSSLSETGLPLLLAAGTGDVWPDRLHREYAHRLGARFLLLNTGHSPCETTPHQLTEAMLDLMRG
ncbi:MAG: alpha/beta fold hydrolase [Leucobacter sp.]